MALHFAPGRTVLLGTALVLALVALQPLALGFFPVGSAGADAGIGTGTGDLAAGALSAVVRDLNTEGAPRAQALASDALRKRCSASPTTPRSGDQTNCLRPSG